MLFLDLDRFKVINDSVGHLVGDEMLKEAGARIASCLRSPDTVARLGGDEFAILLEDIHSTGDAFTVARRVIESLSEPMRVAGKELFTSVSIGIATAEPGSGIDPETMLRDAGLTVTEIGALTSPQVVSLSTTVIADMSVGQFQALSATQIGALSQAQILALTAPQVGAFMNTQMAGLTPLEISTFTETTQIPALTTTALGYLNPTQNNAFTNAQVLAMTGAQRAVIGR